MRQVPYHFSVRTRRIGDKMAGRWYSIKEAAEQLGVSHDTVARLVARGELPAIRVSERIVRIPVPAFEAYASGRKVTARRVVRRRVTTGVPFGAHEVSPDLQPA
jgi:excisionase family DNA binding protein